MPARTSVVPLASRIVRWGRLVELGRYVAEPVIPGRRVGLLVVRSDSGVPPGIRLAADRRQLGLGIDEPIALHGGQLVFLAHGDGIDGTDLGAEPAEHAAPCLEHELAQLTVALLRWDDVHLQTGRRADAGAETARNAECLAGLRIGAQRGQSP